MNEASARIKINKLLESAGWRFFADGKRPANVQLEPKVGITSTQLDELGNDFEKTEKGFVDFWLLNEKGFPFIVLEAKSEMLDPRIGKEQARKYAKSLNCRFVILSNGKLHYFWDLERGEPYLITAFPTPESVSREYVDATDQIREVLIHGNYFSQKDIEFCLKYDTSPLMRRASFDADAMVAIKTLHDRFLQEYQPKDE